MEELVRLSHICAADSSSHRLKDFNMTIFSGEFVFLAGLYGSGKHLVSHILTGSLTPDSGELTIDGERCIEQDARYFTQKGIYSLEDADCLVEEMSICENIFLLNKKNHHGLIFPKRVAAIETRALLKQLGVDRDPMEKVSGLSPFEKLMVSLARVLSCSPRLLILNSARYDLSGDKFIQISKPLLSLKEKGLSCLFISNYPNLFTRISDTAVITEDGTDKRTLRFQPITPGLIDSYIRESSVRTSFAQSGPQPSAAGVRILLKSSKRTSCIWSPGGITGIYDSFPDALQELSSYIPRFRQSNDAEFFRQENGAVIPLHPKKLHWIPENIENTLLESMSLPENIMLPRYHKLSGSLGLISSSITAYCAKDFLSRIGRTGQEVSIQELNGLERRLLGIYRFFIPGTQALFLDYPYMNMDAQECDTIEALLKEISASGTAVFISSRQLEFLKRRCSKVLVCEQAVLKTIWENG